MVVYVHRLYQKKEEYSDLLTKVSLHIKALNSNKIEFRKSDVFYITVVN